MFLQRCNLPAPKVNKAQGTILVWLHEDINCSSLIRLVVYNVILAGKNISQMLLFSAIAIGAERCALLVLLGRATEAVTECIPACTSWMSLHGSEQEGKEGEKERGKERRKKGRGKGRRKKRKEREKEGRKEEGGRKERGKNEEGKRKERGKTEERKKKERKRSTGSELLLYQKSVIIPPTKALPSQFLPTEITHFGELLAPNAPTWQNSADNILAT